jgi:murein DD-endopeptidase MepM/ murein hydrolase activator NlpD
VTSLADVFVTGRVDTSRMGSDIRRGADSSQTRSGMDQAGKKMGGRFSGAFKNALKIGGAVAAAAGVVYLKDAVSAAADLGETLSKTQQIFGGRQGNRLAEWADNASTSLGQTKQQALDAAATFGIFGKSAQLRGNDLRSFSTEMTTLASDLASFNNTSPDEAINALGSALRGEAEPLRRYGVMLDDATLKAEALALGILKPVKDQAKIESYHVRVIDLQKQYNDAVKEHGKGSLETLKAEAALGSARSSLQKATEGTIPTLTAQQKVLAARSAIMKQTSDAQGDFARTSDGLANQQRILTAQWEDAKVTVGEVLLPAVTRFVTFLNEKAIPFAKDAAAVFKKDWLPTLKDVSGWIGDNVVPVLKDMAKWVMDNKAVVGTFIGVLGGFAILRSITGAVTAFNIALAANPIGLVVVGLAALAAGLVYAYKKSETFRDVVDGAFEKVAAAGRWLWNEVLQPVFQFLVKGFAEVMDMYAAMLRGLSKVPGFGWAESAADKMGAAADNARKLAEGIRDIPAKKDIKINVGATYANAKETFTGKLAGNSYDFGGSGGASSMLGAIGGDMDKFATEVAEKVRTSAAVGRAGRVMTPGAYSIGMPYLGYPGHYGADYPAATGTPVYAAAAGIVTRALSLAGSYGQHIFLGHPGGTETRYAHLSQMFVRPGQMVRPGQAIGAVGSTGNSTGPHLHFEYRKNGSPINPASLGIFDKGGLLRHGGMAVNMSGETERILDPRQTANFERLTRALDKQTMSGRHAGAQRIILDVGGGKTLTGVIRDEIDSDGSFTRTTGRMR